MPLLYYWRGDNYRRDLDGGAAYHLNQKNPLLHELDVGDSLWAFTRRADGAYVLAAELIVSAKTFNPPSYEYGRYRVWGDLGRSRYFALDQQSDITPLVKGLTVKAKAVVLGMAFQGGAAVRRLAVRDHALLVAYAHDLALEPRARLLSEEALEVLAARRDATDELERLIDGAGFANERARELMEIPKRSQKLVDALRALYDGRCQICAWDPPIIYGAGLCEVHHVRWLCRGGGDELSNLVLLCPNHHRAIHRCDAPFDFGDLSFNFGSVREPLRLLDHELRPA
jgi:5-methylcytosine-specific restriction enzyme A